jgi:3-oxoadipate enol-lactonase
MPFARSEDGVRLYYETVGAGEPLLLVSGQGGDRHMWDDIRRDFADRHLVVTFDHRGTGDSDKPEAPPYSTRGFAADAVAVLDAAGISRAHVYGISMGGRIGQWLGIEHKERVGALVLGCTTPGNAHGLCRPPEIDAVMKAGEAQRLIDLLVSPEWRALHPEFSEWMERRAQQPIPPHAQRLHYLASEAHDAWDRLPDTEAPTLIIHGTDDQVNVTANAPLLAERIPGAELHLVERGRHLYLVEFRDEASGLVNEFLDRHPLAR